MGFSSKNFDLKPNLENGDKRKMDAYFIGQLKEIIQQINGADKYDIARLILVQQHDIHLLEQQMIDGLSQA